MILFEGGNIWDDVETNFDPLKVGKPLADTTQKFLDPLKTKLHVIGSAWKPRYDAQGNVVTSNDLDSMIELQDLMKVFKTADAKTTRKALSDYLKKQNIETKQAGVTVHTRMPMNGKFYQVDIKVIPNAAKVAQFHRHEIPKGSPYKGVNKQLVMNALASSQGMLWSPDEGLYKRDQAGKKSDLISDDWDTIAKYLLGKGAKGVDLGSVESIMAKIPSAERREEIMTMARSGHSWQQATPNLTEAAKVGRKYQHIEDLVLSHGSHGGLHAVERLRDMATSGGSIELKWDGMPVVYWGRDENGTFMMIPKNAWAYLKSGKTQTSSGAPTVMKSPKDVQAFVMGTGSGDPKERQKFANQFASLWPYFEKVSPEKGFLEGGLLFYPGTKPDGQSAMPVVNKKTKTYDFQPNITQFHVPIDSELGKKIANAKVMVAATGYYPTLGSSEEQRYPDAQALSTNDVIVQGTTYVQDPVELDTKGLDNIEQFIEQNKTKIDNFLAPKPGLSNPGGELYTYLNQHLRTDGLLNDFPKWAKANLSEKKAQAILSDKEGLVATLGAVEGLSKQKTSLIQQLSAGSHGGIKQTKPEGYAQAHPGGKFRYDIPGQFIKAIDQKTWSPKASAVREDKAAGKKAVLGWGRGMGHTGHDALASAVIHQAENTGATPFFIVSRSFGKDDPIPPEMKLAMYQKKFPKYKNIFSLPTADKPTLNDVLTDLAKKGYTDIDLVVGADQKDAFGYLLQPAKSTGVEPYKSFGLNSLNVMSRQDTKAPGSDPESPDYHEGPRATPMRQVLLDPNKTEEEQFIVWRDAMSPSLSDEEVMDMMKLAKDNLVQFNQPKPKKVKAKLDTKPKGRKLKEFYQKLRPLLSHATPEQQDRLYKILETAKNKMLEKSSKKSINLSEDYLSEK